MQVIITMISRVLTSLDWLASWESAVAGLTLRPLADGVDLDRTAGAATPDGLLLLLRSGAGAEEDVWENLDSCFETPLGFTVTGGASFATRLVAAAMGGAMMISPQDGHGPSFPASEGSTTRRVPHSGQPKRSMFFSDDSDMIS